MPGITPHPNEINAVAGTISRDLMDAFDNIDAFNDWVVGLDQAMIDALGLDPNDVAAIGAAISDMMQLRSLYTGTGTLTEAKDFRTTIRKLAGIRVEI